MEKVPYTSGNGFFYFLVTRLETFLYFKKEFTNSKKEKRRKKKKKNCSTEIYPHISWWLLIKPLIFSIKMINLLFFYSWHCFIKNKYAYKHSITQRCYGLTDKIRSHTRWVICITFMLLQELNKITSLSGYFPNL